MLDQTSPQLMMYYYVTPYEKGVSFVLVRL